VRFTRVLAAIVGCLLAAAACSGTSGTSAVSPGASVPASSVASASFGDTCSLLTQAQVGFAIDFTVNSEIGDSGGLGCTWTYSDPNNMADFNTARLVIIDPGALTAMRNAEGNGTITPASGIGDAAYFAVSGTGATSLSVQKGGRAFTVSVLGAAYTTAQSEADEAKLAGYVLARL
jgi:hypothetical protein